MSERALDELDDLRADNERLRKLILDAEWSGEWADDASECPWCCGIEKHGHKRDCPAFSAPGVPR